MGKVADLVNGHRIVAIDTCCFIYLIGSSQYPDFAPITQELFELVHQGVIKAITSPITITEIMVLPRKLGLEKQAYEYKLLIANFPNLSIPAINVTIADRAAIIRSAYGLKTPDALQLATALTYKATAFFTFDNDFKKVSQVIEVVSLSQLSRSI